MKQLSDQHKDMSSARQARCERHSRLDLINYLRVRDRFVNNTSLLNIANGKSAHEGVTADNARDIGKNILSSMIGESVDEFKFRKCNQAMNLNSM